VYGPVIGLIGRKAGPGHDHGNAGAAFVDRSFEVIERSVDGADVSGSSVIVDEDDEGLVGEGDRAIPGGVIEFVEDVADFLVHRQDHGGVFLTGAGEGGKAWVIEIRGGADGTVWGGEGNVEKKGIVVVVVAIDEVHRSDSEGVGDVVSGGVPGSGGFEDGIGEGGGRGFAKFSRAGG